jgi:two-component system, OmpR family, sensor kinase
MDANDWAWLLLGLAPGLVGALGALVWLWRRGVRRGRLWLGLAGPGLLWLAGAGLSLSPWRPLGLVLLSLAFAAALFLLAGLIAGQARHQAEAARLLHIVDARSDRITALSHEIRTPLAMIKGAVGLLLEGNPGPLTSQQTKFLQTISQNCENTILLAEDLLVQARIEAGMFKLRLEPVDIKALAWQAKETIQGGLTERGQTLSLDHPQVMERVPADPRLLTQALTNLLHNASRHTSHGGQIFLTIANNDAEVAISVTDDGAGMSAEERQRLFQKFASGRPLGDGTGLGLVITKQIVELHGGQILVDTSLGRGTTVLFTLPRRLKEQDGQTTRAGG